jgi:hypothetical protein
VQDDKVHLTDQVPHHPVHVFRTPPGTVDPGLNLEL